MAEVTREIVEEAIKGYVEPHLETDLVTAKSVKDVSIDGDKVKVAVVLGFPAKGVYDDIALAVKAAVEAIPSLPAEPVPFGEWEVQREGTDVVFLAVGRMVAEAAKAAGVQRIVYLGGLGEPDKSLSKHLRSRQETGQLLRESGVEVIEFRASIVIGSGSLSFDKMRVIPGHRNF